MANTTNRVAGTVTFTIDGSAYEARGSFTVNPSTVKREGIAGQSGVQGYTETPIVPVIKGDLTTSGTLSLATLEQITGSTVQIDLANGISYILSQAWVTSDFEVNTSEGRVPVVFQGMAITEIV